jgi:hypothetical protein
MVPRWVAALGMLLLGAFLLNLTWPLLAQVGGVCIHVCLCVYVCVHKRVCMVGLMHVLYVCTCVCACVCADLHAFVIL